MIFDKLENCHLYRPLSPRFTAAFDFLRDSDLLSLPVGRIDIDGERVYVLNQCQPLRAWEECRWEAHERYADIQVVLKGDELMGFRTTQGLRVDEAYDSASDTVFFREEPGVVMAVRDNDFLVFFPTDAHRPCLRPEGTSAGATSRRAVVKVLL